METVYDHNITEDEKFALCISNRSKEKYLSELTEKDRIFDLALLYEFREQPNKAKEFWQLIPDEWFTYKLGNSDVAS
jgi:hypothetical protein